MTSTSRTSATATSASCGSIGRTRRRARPLLRPAFPSRPVWPNTETNGRRRRATLWVVLLLSVCMSAGGCANERRSPGRERKPQGTPPLVVPKIVGLPQSRVERALKERGLRWRYGGDRRVHRRPTAPPGVVVSPDPKVVSQRPQPGARSAHGSVVVVETECTRRRLEGKAPCL